MTIGYTPITFEFEEIYQMVDRVDKAQYHLTEQVLKDSNYYIPKDTGALEASSRITDNSKTISWNTPYARRQYYGVHHNFSTDVNPNASALWFERAKANHIDDWVKLVRGLTR